MEKQVEEVLGKDLVKGFNHPGPVMKGLPGAAYTSEAFFRLEQQKVFQANWSLAGFVHELPAPGNARPSLMGGVPIVAVHGSDGRIRVFHNVCRHRGLQLVDQPCSGKKRLMCPYHAWTYGLDGKLVMAPHFGGLGKQPVAGFDYADYGLKEVRSAVWHDWIFVNIDGKAPAFEDFLAPLKAYIGDLDLDHIHPIIEMDSGTVNANWKFLSENFCEPYHVPVVHPETAAGQPLKDHYMVRDRHLTGCGIKISGEIDDLKPPRQGGRDLCLDISAWYLVLFPHFNFFVYFGDDTHVYVMLNSPIAPGLTHQRRVIYQIGGTKPSEASKEEWRRLNADVVREDWDMAERLQLGRASPVMADGGVMSPVWEVGEHGFDELVMEAMSR